MSRTVYLDNASTSWPKPPEVGRAMAEFLARGSATPGRGGYRMAADNAALIERCRVRMASMLGVGDHTRIVLATGATEALNIAIAGLLAWREDRVRVVTTMMDHNSVRRPLAHFRRIGRIDLHAVPADAQGRVDPERIADATDDRTGLVAVLAVSNALGTVLDYHGIARAVRQSCPRALLLLDASQAAGVVPIDGTLFDLIAFPGHKGLLGPTGTGILYVSPRATGGEGDALLRLVPARFGGTGGESAREDMPDEMPRRFETGSPNTVGFAGLLAALDSRPMPPEQTLEHERTLARRVIEHVRQRGGTVLGPTDIGQRSGVVSFNLPGWSPQEAAAALDAQFGICCRAGLHCAPGAHQCAGTYDQGGAVRVSIGPYNTDDDIDALCGAIDALTAG